jgi:hypothetical protein
MEEALVWVVVGAVVVGVVGAVAAAAMRGSAYDHIGRSGLALEDPAPPGAGSGGAAVRDEELRQMLEARNTRRARRGQPPADVDAELARLARPAADHALEAEIRQVVEARNRRRAQRGQAPLDVEAEVIRQLGGGSP